MLKSFQTKGKEKEVFEPKYWDKAIKRKVKQVRYYQKNPEQLLKIFSHDL